MKITLKELKKIIKEKDGETAVDRPITNVDIGTTIKRSKRAEPVLPSQSTRPSETFDFEDTLHLIFQNIDNLNKKSLYATQNMDDKIKEKILHMIDNLEDGFNMLLEKISEETLADMKSISTKLMKIFEELFNRTKEENFKELYFVANQLKDNALSAMQHTPR